MATVEDQVAHVYRRMGFGPTRGDIDKGVAIGSNALINDLCNRPLTTQTQWAFPTGTDWQATDQYLGRMVELMAYGSNPLQERIAWILHGLVVIAIDGTTNFQDLKAHISLLRSSVSGSYKKLLADVSITPGMLKYLSGYLNSKDHPNENYARELCELFSLGVTNPMTGKQNYTEKDVKEIARALTGWRYNWNNGTAFFQFSSWDSGPKTFLGANRGNAKLEEVLEAITSHPSWRYYVPRRFYRELVGLEPNRQTLEQLGMVFGPHGDLKALVQAIVSHPEFLSDKAIGARVKSPVELIASTAKLLGITNLKTFYLNWHLSSFFGHNPLFAPNVSGWYKGAEWLNPGMYMAWSSFVKTMVGSGLRWDGSGTPVPLVKQLYEQSTSTTAVSKALRLTCITRPTPRTISALNEYVKAGPWNVLRAVGLLNLIFLSPEYFTN
jgi:hypothetical protein